MAADLLEQRREAGKAEIQSAIRLTERHRAPAQLQHALPDLGAITGGNVLVTYRPLHGSRRTRRQEVARAAL
ncbi:hypothetical protein D3C84_1103050 [compost metagenome]